MGTRHGRPSGREGTPPAPSALQPRRPLPRPAPHATQSCARAVPSPRLPAWCGPGQPAALPAAPMRAGRGGVGAVLPAVTAAIGPGPEVARARIVRLSALRVLSSGQEPHNSRRRYGCVGTDPAWVQAVPAPVRCRRGRILRATAAPSDPRHYRAPSVSERAAGPHSAAEIDTVTASPRPLPAIGAGLEQSKGEFQEKECSPSPRIRQEMYTIDRPFPLHVHAQQLMQNKWFSRHLHVLRKTKSLSRSHCAQEAFPK